MKSGDRWCLWKVIKALTWCLVGFSSTACMSVTLRHGWIMWGLTCKRDAVDHPVEHGTFCFDPKYLIAMYVIFLCLFASQQILHCSLVIRSVSFLGLFCSFFLVKTPFFQVGPLCFGLFQQHRRYNIFYRSNKQK